jgi:hypothetical protein
LECRGARLAPWTGRVGGGKEQGQLHRPRHGSHDAPARSIMRASRRSLHFTGSLSQRVLARPSLSRLPPSCLLASGSLYADRSSLQPRRHFTHALHIPAPLSFHLAPFPRPSRAPAFFHTCTLALRSRWIRWRCCLDFLFRPLSFHLRLTAFPPMSTCWTVSINASALFLDT